MPAEKYSRGVMTEKLDVLEQRPGNGVIWVNSSHERGRYVREAERSAKTVRLVGTPGEFLLVSDRTHDDIDPIFDMQHAASFEIPSAIKEKLHLNGQMSAKLSVLKQAPWEHNLYLGADVVALKPGMQDIFRLLDEFDVVVAHAPTRIHSRGEQDPRLLSLPDAFPEMNCDLIGFRRSSAVVDFLTRWESAYTSNEFDHPHDQGAFRYLLYKSKLRFYILSPEYNFREFAYSPTAINLQRREMNRAYAMHYLHVRDIYGAPQA
jgi:hypothetical protein